jgi:hypothetical protein
MILQVVPSKLFFVLAVLLVDFLPFKLPAFDSSLEVLLFLSLESATAPAG